MTSFDTGTLDLPMALGFIFVFGSMLLPPWAVLTLLPFNLVRRWREIDVGLSYGNGS